MRLVPFCVFHFVTCAVCCYPSIVPAEEGDSFPFEALKAQAVAARTFALDRLGRRGYANGGQAYTGTVGAKSRNATVNTAKIVLRYGAGVFPAYFSARCWQTLARWW